jgi:hypothetical protein
VNKKGFEKANVARKKKGNETRNKIISFIETFVNKNGYSPTVREIADGSGIKSTSTAQRQLEILKAWGKITWQPLVPRTIKLVGMEIKEMDHPVIEQIQKTGYPKMKPQHDHWGVDVNGNEILVGDNIVRLPNGEIILEDALEDYLIETLGFEYEKAN